MLRKHRRSGPSNTDLELTELDVLFRKRIGGRTELGLQVPVLRPTAGFLDASLASLHDFLRNR